MNAFVVTVRRLGLPDEVYLDAAVAGATLVMAALDRFGACGVSVKPA